MKKRMIPAVVVLSLLLTACGGGKETAGTSPSLSSAETQKDQGGTVKVEKELFDVVITVPADFVGETTQEELDERAGSLGYKIKLNEDGSATYTMTKSQHREMVDEMKKSMDETISKMIGSEDYPTFTDIKTNDNFTQFTVTTTSTELGLGESLSVLGFYMYGGMYNVFNGTPVDNVHVEFINADSGQVLSSSDSKDMGK